MKRMAFAARTCGRSLTVATALSATVAATLLGGPAPSIGVAGAVSAGASSGPDFDADGFDELVIGARHDVYTGSVTVLYGTAAGPATERAQYWAQDTPGLPGDGGILDDFGRSVSWGDYDGDGFDDLAIGVPGEDVPLRNQGAVQVLYGSPTGLTADDNYYFDADVVGSAGSADDFGTVLTSGDFDGDGVSDLAVAATGAARDDAAVVVLYGRSSGLSGAGADYFDEEGLGILAAYSSFGSALAAGDTDGDGADELAIGTPGAYDGAASSGAVYVLPGSPDGLVGEAMTSWWQSSPGVPGHAEGRDGFYGAVMGDFDADGFADLVIGAPTDREQGVRTSSVTLLYGGADGLSSQRAQRFDQLTPGIGGHNKARDQLGSAFAVADLNGDGFADLAAGNYTENVKTEAHVSKAGDVLLLYGGSSGLSVNGSRHWNQDSRKIKDRAERDDAFGRSLAAADYDGDGYGDLVVAAPGEDDWAGVVHLLSGSADGATGRGNARWSQDSRGMPSDKYQFEYFGCAVGAVFSRCS